MCIYLEQAHGRLKPMLGMEPDDVAFTNCGLCSDITDGVPLCDYCWSDPSSFDKADAIMQELPADWPGEAKWKKAWTARKAAQ